MTKKHLSSHCDYFIVLFKNQVRLEKVQLAFRNGNALIKAIFEKY